MFIVNNENSRMTSLTSLQVNVRWWGLFRALSNIYDGTFGENEKVDNGFLNVNYYPKKIVLTYFTRSKISLCIALKLTLVKMYIWHKYLSELKTYN